MGTQNKKNKRNLITTIIIVVLLVLGFSGFYLNFTRKNKHLDNKQDISQNEDSIDRLVCDRTTRLDNDPNIDRALSLIYERLTEYGEDDSLFPPQLVNCIKVEVKNIKNDTGAEGYFDENNENIKPNYYPIMIDDWENFFADDLSTALLLVHEITHVQQYIDSYNASIDPNFPDYLKAAFKRETKSGCLDNEVFAYKNQLKFILKLKDEEKKSIDYRVLADENLHSQLEILKSLKDSLADLSIRGSCEIYDNDCINRYIHMRIYDLLRDSGEYDEQCGVYEGSYIGE